MSGCYNPQLQSPGFFCHPTDNPACPEGQECVSGKCRSKNGRPPGNFDLAMSGNEDFGGGNVDFSMPFTPPDMARTGGMTGCNGLITCVNKCPTSDMTCPGTCQNNTTANGTQLFNNLINCILAQCPNMFPGDVCFNSSSTACTQCFQAAQSGACMPDLTTCHNDLP